MDEDGVQSPILLCAQLESDEEDHPESFYGSDCTEPFFEWLESLAADQDGDDRSVIAVFYKDWRDVSVAIFPEHMIQIIIIARRHWDTSCAILKAL